MQVDRITSREVTECKRCIYEPIRVGFARKKIGRGIDPSSTHPLSTPLRGTRVRGISCFTATLGPAASACGDRLMLRFLSSIFVVLLIGVFGSETSPDTAQQICAACSCVRAPKRQDTPSWRQTMTDDCFELVNNVCEWDPDDVGPNAHIDVKRRRLNRQWSFCVGHMASSKADMYIGAYLRVESWINQNCTTTTPCPATGQGRDEL